MLTEEEKERYQRQILIFGEEGQAKLKTKTVLQVGAGGLGSPLALYLISAGVGHLIIFENDTLSLSNLGRQILYRTADVGNLKAELAKEVLSKLNPNCKITIINEWLTKENAPKYLENVDYLVDASDNFTTKFLINDLGLEYNIPFTIAGIEGFDGQLISVDPHQTACYRCVFGNGPKSSPKGPIPVASPTCGVVGSLEANEIIKGLLGYGKRVLNSLLIIGLADSDITRIPIKANPKCICRAAKK